MSLPEAFKLSLEVKRALALKNPLVALESTVITHGLPRPQNLALAQDMEQEVRRAGAQPATVAVLDGWIRVGLSYAELDRLASVPDPVKVSHRDFAGAYTWSYSGGTTVAGTMYAASMAGIRVFATGGIGGVHKEARFDVSSDLQALASTPMIVVCAGAKSILDLPATLEYLETMGVPVMGYKTDAFPEFYSRGKDLCLTNGLENVETPQDVVNFAQAHWDLGFKSAVLVCQPVPEKEALPDKMIRPVLEQVSREVREQGISGQEVTPFELKRINELTGGKALKANLALLLNNASLAGQIAKAWAAARTHTL